jgi:hypothetical protein
VKKVTRSLHLITAAGAATREETYKGRPYLVVPVVALVEGVIWPVNAEAPEYVTPESYSLAPETWNGRPIFPGHPERGGTQVLGNVPEILESEQIGIVFNSGVVDVKLAMEAWLNKEDCEAVGEVAVDIYDRAASGKPIEISVGAVVLMEEVEGEYNGQEYVGKWIEVFSDHLALLPAGDVGACSIAMGCGVRTATVHRITAKGYERVTAERKEEELPEVKNKKVTEKRSLLQRLGGLLRMASPAGRSDTEVRSELVEALEEKEPRMKYNGWVVDVYENEGLVVYCMYDESYDMDLFVRDFKWDGKTAVIGDLYAEVEAHTVYEVEDDENQANEVLITQLRVAQKLEPKAATAPCGCGGNKTTEPVTASTSQGETMKTRDQRIMAMIAASAALIAAGKKAPVYAEADKPWLTQVPDAHFDSLEAAVVTPVEEPVVPTTPPTTAVATTAAAAAQPLTEAQFMAAAPQSLKRTLARAQASETARKSFLTGRLKTAQTEYDEAALVAMDIDELERMARMLKVSGPVDAASDFSGQGSPRETFSANGDVPAPPDMNAAVRTASSKK